MDETLGPDGGTVAANYNAGLGDNQQANIDQGLWDDNVTWRGDMAGFGPPPPGTLIPSSTYNGVGQNFRAIDGTPAPPWLDFPMNVI